MYNISNNLKEIKIFKQNLKKVRKNFSTKNIILKYKIIRYCVNYSHFLGGWVIESSADMVWRNLYTILFRADESFYKKIHGKALNGIFKKLP